MTEEVSFMQLQSPSQLINVIPMLSTSPCESSHSSMTSTSSGSSKTLTRKFRKNAKFDSAVDPIVASIKQVEPENVFTSFAKTISLQLQLLSLTEATETMTRIHSHVTSKLLRHLKKPSTPTVREQNILENASTNAGIDFEENEDYQTQCGEMFFTTKGRLIFHCTLCEEKFYEFNFYEVHIKEHIPITFNDGEGQVDKTDSPSQHDTVDDFENEFKKSITANESQQLLYFHMKEELNDSMDEVLKEEEISLSEIKRRKRPHLKSGRRVSQGATKTAKTAPSLIKSKIKTNSIDHKTKAKQPPQDSEGNRSKNIVKQKESSHQNNIKIPTVVREVQTRIFARSLLIPPEERKHKCPVCERAFRDRHNVIHHLKRHSNNKDHKCPECSKGFYTSAEVRIHMRSHSDERPFLCNICGRSYVSKSHLVEHLTRHSNQRKHKCKICEKAFNTKSQLTGHMVAHSSDRPFACEICGANFTRQMALRNHMKLHENKREFKCKLCDSGFNQRAGLFSHMKTAHKTE